MPRNLQKISEYLSGIYGYGIFDSKKAKEDFIQATGHEANWPEHSELDALLTISEKGLGGHFRPQGGNKMVCYGYEMAIALAQEYVLAYHCSKLGRGSQFREAVQALKESGN